MADGRQTPCPCPLDVAGWCPLHEVNKGRRMRELCATRPAYFDQWHARQSPQHGVTQQPRLPRRWAWGDALAWALGKVGITRAKIEKYLGRSCGCAKRQQKLNHFGARAAAILERVLQCARMR